MSDKIDNIKKEVWANFKDFQCVFLATVEGNQPRVRPVTLIYFDKRFWIMTNTGSAKVKQIQKNPKIELCLFLERKKGGNSYIRIIGMARLIRDKTTKARIARHCDFFSRHWKSVDDPDYTLIEICPKEVEYLRAGEFFVRKFKVSKNG
ncbi:MAG: pyridoxamine 5'-phosphate oxidase family protein [Candidatus Edwardsbacteria bacterium]